MNDFRKLRKHKNYDEIYGKERAEQIRKKQSLNAIERYKDKRNHPGFGTTRSEHTRKLLSIAKQGDKNPAKRADVRKKMSLNNNGRKWKNKTYEEIFGVVKAKQIKQRQSASAVIKKIKMQDTSIELAIQHELSRRNIQYETQKPLLKKYRVDIFIKPNIIVECDGDYWHNLPERITRDNLRNKDLKQAGYDVYRFWEHEIHQSSEKCINQLKL